MSTSLRRDICSLQLPCSLLSDVARSRVEQCIRPELQYACLYWVEHLQKSDTVLSDGHDVYQFLRNYFLHWLEALAWLGKTSEAILALISLHSQIKVSVIHGYQDWTNHWREGSQHPHNPRELGARSSILANTGPTSKVLLLHQTLKKAESSILVQMRTRCIGLRKFLYGCRVPDIDSPMCACGGGEETAEHIAILCPLESSKRHALLDVHGRQHSWNVLIGKPTQARQLTRWLIESDRIHQFSLARKLLYGNEVQDQ